MSDGSLGFAWLSADEGGVARTPSWIAPRLSPQEPRDPPTSEAVVSFPPPVSESVPPRSLRGAAGGEGARISVAPEPLRPPYPDLRQENESLKNRIAEMAAAQASFRRDVLRATEHELVRLACAVAERITREELRIAPSIVVGWVREAIDAVENKEGMIIALAPDLASALASVDWSGIAGGTVRVETDSSLGPLQCEVRARSTTVDTSLEARLAAVAAALENPTG